ncbi:putative pectinesterase/pectinesterase inhibitor 51 [Salvia divinorum]|uniref:Pectinesterase/pectinesterase inhibitor 51 n=1 Tax=Salvia divinorum TaxID=28513 RepID=A0ABD1FI90_SALDI
MQLRRPIKHPPNHKHAQFHNLRSLLIPMAALISFALLLSLLLFPSLSAARRHRNPHSDARISGSDIASDLCKASRDPQACRSSFPQLPPGATVAQGIQSALDLSSRNLNLGRGMVQQILDASAASRNRTAASKTCLELLRYADHRTGLAAADALPRGRNKDARAWLSAAVVYQYDCWSTLKYANDTSLVDKTMAFFYSSVIPSGSNALSMVLNYDVFGDRTGLWGPARTERDGFWEPAPAPAGPGPAGGVPRGLKADAAVCKEGCEYESVQKAVDAAPDNAGPGARFVIWIKAGLYEETVRVPLEKRNVVFMGDGMGKTVISGSMNVGQQGVSTYNSATVAVVGDGFMAIGLTIQNTAGPDAHQAVAFRSDSDLSVVEECELLGNQDTLYAHSLRQYYKSCRIQGNVDFIFGNSAAFFQDCLILVAPRQSNPEKGENNAVTAQGRIDPAQSTGFVFQDCVINGTDAYMALYYSKPKVHKNYLGRPWKEYSRTVFLHCTLEALIMPDGYLPWNGDFALKTLYYGEFENRGPGSDTAKRVSWSSQIPAEHAGSFSVGNFIQGNEWIPASLLPAAGIV